MFKAIDLESKELDVDLVYFNTYQDEASDDIVIVLEINDRSGNLLVGKEFSFEELVSCKTMIDELVHEYGKRFSVLANMTPREVVESETVLNDLLADPPTITLTINDQDVVFTTNEYKTLVELHNDPDMYDRTNCGTIQLIASIYEWKEIIYDGIAAYSCQYFKF